MCVCVCVCVCLSVCLSVRCCPLRDGDDSNLWFQLFSNSYLQETLGTSGKGKAVIVKCINTE